MILIVDNYPGGCLQIAHVQTHRDIKHGVVQPFKQSNHPNDTHAWNGSE